MIDPGSTHNFIHCKLAKVLNCFIYQEPKFQVMIVDGGTINCLEKCHKINLTMWEYVLNSPMISIPMGGADIVLGLGKILGAKFRPWAIFQCFFPKKDSPICLF